MLSKSPTFKSGFVAVVGHPNVGKSTLINTLVGMKITAVSPWPQTTRKRQMGILTIDEAQIIFIDTPGVHMPLHKLGVYMNQEAADVLEESDLALFIADVSRPPTDEDLKLIKLFEDIHRPIPVLMALNKVDMIDQAGLQANQLAFQVLWPQAETLTISATRGDHLDLLIHKIISRLPYRTPFFPEDQITDLYEREIAADLIREAVLFHLRDEVPHSVAVRIDEYKERDQNTVYIAATLFVERESQIGIVIGQGGQMLKKIGTAARQEIEKLRDNHVYLSLRVKLKKNWRNDEHTLRLFGFGNHKTG